MCWGGPEQAVHQGTLSMRESVHFRGAQKILGQAKMGPQCHPAACNLGQPSSQCGRAVLTQGDGAFCWRFWVLSLVISENHLRKNRERSVRGVETSCLSSAPVSHSLTLVLSVRQEQVDFSFTD